MVEVSYFYRQSMSGTTTERQPLALYCVCFALMCIILMYIRMLYCVNYSYPITELSGGL